MAIGSGADLNAPWQWGNDKTDPIVVNVNGASQGKPQSQNASPASGKVFLKTSIEPRQSYVQAEVDLTVRLYSAVPLYHADLEIPANSDVLLQQVGADRNETIVENGERYQVIERHYELFPQRSGSLTLSGPVLNAQIAVQNQMDPFGNSFKDFFGNLPFGGTFTTAKPIRPHGDDIALNVLPRPAAAGNEYWLPSRDVTLQGEWRPAHGQIKAGDPVTLDLHLKAQGLTAAQLPDLNSLLKLPDGVKAYPDQAKLTNDSQDGYLVGQRDQSIALIADRAGEFTIPRCQCIGGTQRRMRLGRRTCPLGHCRSHQVRPPLPRTRLSSPLRARQSYPLGQPLRSQIRAQAQGGSGSASVSRPYGR